MNIRGSLPPLKILALHLLVRGPMTFVPDVGWVSEASGQTFNSHTAAFLMSRGFAYRDGGRLLATRDASLMERHMEVQP